MIKKIYSALAPYLQLKTEHSSIRLMSFIVILTSCISIIATLVILLIQSIQCVSIDWIGSSTFIAAITATIGTALWGKNSAKTKETDQPSN
jgi:spore maturation protein SpmA